MADKIVHVLNTKEDVDKLTDEQAGKLFKAIYEYAETEQMPQLDSLLVKLKNCENEANTLNAVLDSILEQQSTQREQIVRLQNRFRVNKGVVASNREIYNIGVEVLEDRILTIEKMFSTFEEWMYASEFGKAANQQIEINEEILELAKKNLEYKTRLYEAKEISKTELETAVESLLTKIGDNQYIQDYLKNYQKNFWKF